MFKKTLLSLLCLGCLSIPVQAKFLTAVSLGVGNGPKDDLWGSRLSLQADWPTWFKNYVVNLTGYWDGSVGYWHTTSDNGNHNNLGIFAISPVVKLQFNRDFIKIFDPYLQAGIGASLATNTHFGNSNFGSVFVFQDLIGGGIRIGDKLQYDLSYNYLHYSNANISPPNNGLTAVHYLSFTYHFA
jgi:lipid A 3-O-deacylase